MRSPESFWLLFLLPPVGYLMALGFRTGRRELRRFKGRGPVSQLFDVFTIKWFFSSLFFILFIIFTIFSLVGFQTERDQPEEVPPEVDVMFVVDLSRSMLAEDIRSNRLERGKTIIRGMIDRISKARFGITVYKGSAYTLVPMTEDRSSVESALELLSPSLFTSPGTDMESGVRRGVESFPKSEQRRNVLILLSDGESHSGRPVEAAREGSREGISIHCVGLGTEEGGKIPVSDDEYLRDERGELVVSKLRESLLLRTAEAGKGSYLSLEDSPSIDAILEEFELTTEEGKIRYSIHGRYKGLLLISLIFLLLSILVKVVPWRGTF